MGVFVALDFETADRGRDSACAVGLVRVEAGRITARAYRLIRPPRRQFEFTHIHGLSWADVERQPDFGSVWPALVDLLEGADFIAAHHAEFERAVLVACCARARLPLPSLPFECTVALARQRWNIYPTRLPNVCRRLGVKLHHHDALSDAEACAQVVMKAETTRSRPALTTALSLPALSNQSTSWLSRSSRTGRKADSQ